MANILHVDGEPSLGILLDDGLRRAGHTPVAAANVVEALQVLARGHIDLIIADCRITELTGLEFLALLRREGYHDAVILLTGDAGIEPAVEAIEAGAFGCLTKPIDPRQLELAVHRALEVVRLRRENTALRREVIGFRNDRQIIGESVAIRRIRETIAMAAATSATMLLRGESGTGKEMVARAIHDQSDRHDRPFVALDCAGLPDGLIESALFGHERGAFAGAAKRAEGAFERANGGTLLLDDVSEMKAELQAKLVRVLQQQQLERVGGTTSVPVDTRVIATTNRDLTAAAAAGSFRQDLFEWVSAIPIDVPPLRERIEDIPPLAWRFALRTAAEIGKDITGICRNALARLTAYPWPGNVRELRHAVERAVILSSEPVLQADAFDALQSGLVHPLVRQAPSPRLGAPPAHGPAAVSGTGPPAGAIMLTSLNIDDAERVLIQRALEATNNNRTRTAQLLGISVRTLRNKLNGPGRKEVA